MNRLTLLLSLLLFPLYLWAAEPTPSFTAGKEYQVVEPSADYNNLPKDKVLVQEFFSYGCPACYRMEPTLQTWLKKKPTNVEFDRIPVVFETNWATYARAYYAAKALGILTKITPDLFTAIQDHKEDLSSKEAMGKFFGKYGINQEAFTNTYELSPGIGIQLKNADSLMTTYKVYEVPTIIVGGRYKTSAMMVNGDEKKFIQMVNYLIDLEMKQQVKK
jgi:thiol:disulfide interchange protein DsbA